MSITLSPVRARLLLTHARKALKTNPVLAAASSDPNVAKTLELLVATMRDQSETPAAMNALRHLLENGYSEEQAAIQAALIERQSKAASDVERPRELDPFSVDAAFYACIHEAGHVIAARPVAWVSVDPAKVHTLRIGESLS